MKKYICILAGAALLVACENKETTVTPPGDTKTENNTTVVKESPAAPSSKTENNTTVNTGASPSGGTKTETSTTTSSSPNP
jgi:PBP1b-binding outer membrane lipoprotein LpoB